MISIFAMTEKGFTVISKLIDQFGSSFIDMVVGAEDKKIENDYYANIKELCLKNDISFTDRKSNYEIESTFCFAISWQWLISLKDDKKLIVFHDSILPKYRGFTPLVNSLINGEKEIGVTALFASGEYDKGDIIHQSKTSIGYPIKIAQAIKINNENYIKSAVYVSGLIKGGSKLNAEVQNENEATYSLWRDEDDYRIDWSQHAEQIKRLVDATGSPYKNAFAMAADKKIRIIDVEIVADLRIENRHVGKFINISAGMPVVVCGKGLLKITNAIFDDNKESFLPVKKFRTRLI